MIWKPNVTVAAIIERNSKFLLVEEKTDDGNRLNQPAGHLEPGESIIAGVIREALEETAYHFRPEWLVGIYRWHHEVKKTTYLRFAFCGQVAGPEPGRALDHGIVCAHWLTLDEIRAASKRHRSPLVMQCTEDYIAGQRYSLDIVHHA